MPPAIASITSVNDVRASEPAYRSCIVRSGAIGILAFTDRTACRTSSMRLAVPARSLRITNATDRRSDHGAPNMFSASTGQYTKLGASSYNPASCTLCTTPITSRHASVVERASRIRLPSAPAGSAASSRAKSSEITATRPPASMSLQVTSRPAIIRVPMASKYPGETNLHLRAGGVSPGASVWPSTAIGPLSDPRRPSEGGSQSRPTRRPEAPRSCRGSRAACGCTCSGSGDRAVGIQIRAV